MDGMQARFGYMCVKRSFVLRLCRLFLRWWLPPSRNRTFRCSINPVVLWKPLLSPFTFHPHRIHPHSQGFCTSCTEGSLSTAARSSPPARCGENGRAPLSMNRLRIGYQSASRFGVWSPGCHLSIEAVNVANVAGSLSDILIIKLLLLVEIISSYFSVIL